MPFTFVDAGVASDDRDNRRKIRKHLSVFHTLQRRQRDAQKQKNAAELRSTTVVAAGPLAWRHKTGDDEDAALRKRHANFLLDTSSTSQIDVLSRGVGAARISNSSVSSTRTSASLPTVLSASRRDPFSSFPIPTDATLEASVDFFANGLGSYMYGYARNDSFDVLRDRSFLIAAQDPAAFHANMLMACINLDIINGHSLPGIRALRHRVEAIRLINERLAMAPKPLDQSTIYTIITLTALEHVWGAVGRKEVHDGGLEQVLIKCGGVKALRKYPLLEHTVHSIALVTPQMISWAAPELYFTSESHYSAQEEPRTVGAELIVLLESTMSRENSWPLSMLSFAFQPGVPLHDILITPTNEFPQPVARHSSEAAERSRLSILLHIHCILMRLPEHAGITKLVTKLNKLIRDAWIWRRSLPMLQYMIAKADDSAILEDPDLAWHVVRLVEVCRFLSKETYENMKEHLLALLSQPTQHPGLDLLAIRREFEAHC